MAELLTRLDRQSELIEVLGKIHELNPDDLSTVMRLADLHLARKEVDVARGYFEKLSLIGYQQGDFLVSKGRLHELLQQPEHALRCYEAFVKTNPDRFEVRLRVADLAASLGFFSEAGTQLDDLLAMGNKTTAFITEIQLLKAKALREAGFLQAAVEEYRHIISGKGGVASPQQRMLAWQGLAANYHAAGLYYEEEQVLREALADGQTAIEFTKSLFDIAILTGRSDDAEVWLKEMRRQYRRSTGTDFDGQITDWQLRLLEIKLLSVRGGYRIAVRKCRQLFSEFSANRTILNQVGEERQPRLAIGLALCRIYLEDDKLDQAAKLAGTLLDEGWRDYEIFVLLQQVYTLRNASAGEVQEVADMMSREFWDGDLHSADLSNFFILANLYGDYGNKGLQERFAQAAHQRAPDSLKATLLLGQVLIAQSRMREAESLLAVVREHFSGNVIALSELTKIMFKSGRFDEALVLCDAVLDQQLRPDMLLLKARITWSKYRWSEALNIYKSYLEPSVNALLAEQIANHGIVLELAPKKTWWQSFTFTEGKSPEVAEVVMSPHFIVDKSDENRRINSFSAPLYARYRWQQNFAEEFAAKRSVQRRQYNQAVSQHETLLASFADEDSLLYDLAELYGRLDRSEEEAILYEKLQRINPNYPGLDAAMQRNRLKRRPQLSSGYGQITEEGWDNYKSISRKWGELSTRFSPETGHEVSVSLSRINYQDTINQDNQLWAKRAVASYQATVVSGLSAAFSIGIEDPDEDFPSTEVFALSVQGRIGDALKSHLTLTRDVTPDTVASIKRKIGHDLYEAGLAVDFFPRLTLGTDIGQKKFTDGNQTDLYTFWSSYVFFFDPTYLRFRFSYDLQDSRYPPNPGPALSDGFGAEDHPYYSPKAHWLSEFSLLFRHQLPSDTFGRGTLKYYTLEYAWGYDSHEDRLQSMAASLFLELRQHFTVKVSAAVRDLKSYESKELFLTAIYRW
jgi:tetratricopeptide (TPR) repeat protein